MGGSDMLKPLILSEINIPLWIRLIPFQENSYIKKKIDKIVMSRCEYEVEEVWMSIGISYQKIIGILNIIAKYCDWKAIKFIPSDELSCVLMDHDLEMGVVTATMEIEDLYPHVELGQLFEDINSKSNLLDLIRFILDKSNE